MESEKPNIAEKTVKDFADYLNLKADRVGLSIVENMSVFFSIVFAVIITMLLAGIALGFIAVGLTILLSYALESMLLSVTIIAMVYLLAAVIVYKKRKTLITDNMVKVLSKIISDILQRRNYNEKS